VCDTVFSLCRARVSRNKLKRARARSRALWKRANWKYLLLCDCVCGIIYFIMRARNLSLIKDMLLIRSSAANCAPAYRRLISARALSTKHSACAIYRRRALHCWRNVIRCALPLTSLGQTRTAHPTFLDLTIFNYIGVKWSSSILAGYNEFWKSDEF
jgi:hypothetical protein